MILGSNLSPLMPMAVWWLSCWIKRLKSGCFFHRERAKRSGVLWIRGQNAGGFRGSAGKTGGGSVDFGGKTGGGFVDRRAKQRGLSWIFDQVGMQTCSRAYRMSGLGCIRVQNVRAHVCERTKRQGSSDPHHEEPREQQNPEASCASRLSRSYANPCCFDPRQPDPGRGMRSDSISETLPPGGPSSRSPTRLRLSTLGRHELLWTADDVRGQRLRIDLLPRGLCHVDIFAA